MRVSLLVLFCLLSMARPPLAQTAFVDRPVALGVSDGSDSTAPIGSPQGLARLEQAALQGDRHASALLAVLLQDSPEVPGGLVKSALHFQVAMFAGCTDLQILAERAVARLLPDDRASYDAALPHWLPGEAVVSHTIMRARCLSW